MKKFLLGAVSLMGFGLMGFGMIAPAIAADLPAAPYKAAPVMMPAMYDWSGFYVGLNGGWGSSRKCWDTTGAGGVFVAADGCHNATGGLAGAQVGFRWQAGSWVFGIEAQGDWSNLRGSSASLFTPGVTNRSRIDAFGLFTGQVGYAFDTALLYVKGGGGLASDRFDQVTAATNVIAATAGSQNRWGGTVGTGIEFAFMPNWSAAVEYDHLFLRSQATTFTVPAVGTLFAVDRIRQDADLVTVRVNYRWGGPVISKY
jgi:outer membrane immunogenic protein